MQSERLRPGLGRGLWGSQGSNLEKPGGVEDRFRAFGGMGVEEEEKEHAQQVRKGTSGGRGDPTHNAKDGQDNSSPGVGTNQVWL